MNRPYLILVNGVLAKKRKTYKFAIKDKLILEDKGYKNVSIVLDKEENNGVS